MTRLAVCPRHRGFRTSTARAGALAAAAATAAVAGCSSGATSSSPAAGTSPSATTPTPPATGKHHQQPTVRGTITAENSDTWTVTTAKGAAWTVTLTPPQRSVPRTPRPAHKTSPSALKSSRPISAAAQRSAPPASTPPQPHTPQPISGAHRLTHKPFTATFDEIDPRGTTLTANRRNALVNTILRLRHLLDDPSSCGQGWGDCAANGVFGPTRWAVVRWDGHCE